MKSIAALFSFACLAFAMPASAVTIDQGVTLITQADALAGGVTPGDTPGYPISITVPGIYRLASNLQASAGVNGINVTAAEVSIDFAGFRLIGSGTALAGVRGSQRALTVRDGTIRAFTGFGISSTGASLTVERMRLADNGDYAIEVSGSSPRIVRNTIIGNGGGIFCDAGCHIEGNLIVDNGFGRAAYSFLGKSTVIRNLMSGNLFAVTTNDNSGWGDNAIAGNTNASTGSLTTMSPNACSPVC